MKELLYNPFILVKSVGEHSELPGFFPYTRGISPTGYLTQPWLTCQPINGVTAEEANEKIKAVLNRGQNAITYSVDLLANELDYQNY